MPTARVNGIKLSYRVHGHGEPLVMIMAFGGGQQGWHFQTRAFAKHYRVITFDSRGVGRSDDTGESYSMGTMADDTIALMDYLGIDSAHLLGQSLGGVVAQEIAINYPEKVRKLVLASTTAGGRGTADTTPAMLRALGVEEGSTDVDIGKLNFEDLITTLIELSFNRRLYRTILLPLATRYASRVSVGGLARQFEAASGLNALDRLHLVQAPTLVIAGTGDRIVPHDASEVIASRIPGARLVLVEGGSHAFHIEMRGRFNQEVLDFLDGG